MTLKVPGTSDSVVLYDNDYFNSYKVLEKLGKGVNGSVWKVLTPEEEVAALKIHKLGCAGAAYREALLLKKVHGGPHILQLRKAFTLASVCYETVDPDLCIAHKIEDRKRFAILTELLPCKDIHEMFIKNRDLREPPLLSFSQVLRIAKQALEALDFMRSKEIIHCDLKPQNMVYDPHSETLTIIDFGNAQKIDELDFSELTQPFLYRAPECMASSSYDYSIDIWSLGISLFKLYTGDDLFWGTIVEQDKMIDRLHIMRCNLGPLSPAFLDAVPEFKKKYYKMDGSYEIYMPPSKETEVGIDYYDGIAKKKPGKSVLELRIASAGVKRGDSASDFAFLSAVIAPMLSYDKHRITPKAALRMFGVERTVYRNLKDREFGKKAPQNFCSEQATIAQRQGASENENCEAKPTQPKTDSSSYFGIPTLHPKRKPEDEEKAIAFPTRRQTAIRRRV